MFLIARVRACVQEIGAFAWHYLHELPATVEEANRAYIASGGSRHRFFMVSWSTPSRARGQVTVSMDVVPYVEPYVEPYRVRLKVYYNVLAEGFNWPLLPDALVPYFNPKSHHAPTIIIL
eukprot:1142018-Pelagomonas_calceolata.AAC.3